ncbi:hypothetical protein POM88_019056 [Heracleum sosnowskyi]|uniref:Uncharacterized protein n=1 Tax=Heracleum sosnowskyi TaxID=360622 RepID=A0AAD8ITF7_9APIA|nr:hypothetical protein POM88_019056 [Heracleum sosnowskyi]
MIVTLNVPVEGHVGDNAALKEVTKEIVGLEFPLTKKVCCSEKRKLCCVENNADFAGTAGTSGSRGVVLNQMNVGSALTARSCNNLGEPVLIPDGSIDGIDGGVGETGFCLASDNPSNVPVQLLGHFQNAELVNHRRRLLVDQVFDGCGQRYWNADKDEGLIRAHCGDHNENNDVNGDSSQGVQGVSPVKPVKHVHHDSL